MKLKTIFTINYIIAFLFGIGFIIMPAFSLSMMGLDPSGDAPLLAQGWGAFILGTFAITFFARNAPKSEGRRAVVLSLFILYILLNLYKLSLNLFSGIPLNWMFGLLYLIHIVLVILYGYFLFGSPREIDK